MSDFKVKTINTFFKRAVSVLERLDAWLPQPLQEPNWAAVAFRWQQVGQQGIVGWATCQKLLGIAHQLLHLIVYRRQSR